VWIATRLIISRADYPALASQRSTFQEPLREPSA